MLELIGRITNAKENGITFNFYNMPLIDYTGAKFKIELAPKKIDADIVSIIIVTKNGVRHELGFFYIENTELTQKLISKLNNEIEK